MIDFRILFYLIWHAYGEKCISFAQKIAVRKEPSNKLVCLVYYIRLKIAIELAHEALRAFNYANHYIDA